jgi:hypothetical protein
VASNPTLFISGDMDVRTPPANAEEVRRGFSANGHLVLHGGAHDDDLFLSSPIILDRILDFLGGAVPEDETITVDTLQFR